MATEPAFHFKPEPHRTERKWPISPDVFFSTISEIDAKLRAKEFSAVELTRAFCDRLEKHRPALQRSGALAARAGDPASAGRRRRIEARPHARALARNSLRREGSAGGEGQADHLGREAVRGSGVRRRRAA